MYEVELTDPAVIRDPFTAYRHAREAARVVRLKVPGMPMWALTGHGDARAMLTDPRFAITSSSFVGIPGVPAGYDEYLRTMSELDGPDHLRLRRLAAPAFTARRAQDFRADVEPVVAKLLAELPPAPDLLRDFAKPLPMHVICELVGIPAGERPAWVEWGAIVADFDAPRLGGAIPGIVESARSIVAARPRTGLLADLVAAEDRLTDTELVTLVWHLVLAGQTPANLIANAVAELWARPDALAALRADPSLLPGAVDELMRWCGPQLLTVPRHATEDVDLFGTAVKAGEPVTVAIAAANRDPRAFPDPDDFDMTRGAATHLGFGHGPHFCLGAAHARVQTEVALSALLARGLTLAADPVELRAPDPGTWRLTALPVRLGG
ncbi:cytochrome P450 [Actinophytocola sp.]|uniref:cytochrome P450 n=1 Tax=Actinophytocola sp. TaxID=1872138 RepID=UPI002D424A6E|nr:cytochrome P450 [Actinophytocola sp.]HYQ67144.1 cytochrome P450 [Actinophytocola sp.]